jgi:ABC-type sugar transport system substrate-binding protein
MRQSLQRFHGLIQKRLPRDMRRAFQVSGKRLFIMCVALAVLAIAAATAGVSRASHNAQIVVGASTLGAQYPAVVALNKGLEAEASKLGIKLVLLDAQGKADKQNTDIDDLLAQGVQGLVINAIDKDAVVTEVNKALAQKIPTVASFTAFGEKGCVFPGTLGFVGFNDRKLGALAGQEALKLLPNGGKVALITGNPGLRSSEDRSAGFKSAIKANPKIKIVASQPGNFDLATSRTAMENILQAQSKLDLVFASDDGSAIGAIQALKAAKRIQGTKVIGLGGFKIGLKAVQQGTLTATIFSSFKLGGKIALDMVVNNIKNGAKPASACVAVPMQIVTKANVKQFIPKGEV